MAERPEAPDRDGIAAIARVAGLELTPEQAEDARQAYPSLMAMIARLHALDAAPGGEPDPGDGEEDATGGDAAS